MGRVTDKPLHEATANGDGTYNGYRLVRWLFEAATGKEMTQEEAEALVVEAKHKAEDRRAAKVGKF